MWLSTDETFSIFLKPSTAYCLQTCGLKGWPVFSMYETCQHSRTDGWVPGGYVGWRQVPWIQQRLLWLLRKTWPCRVLKIKNIALCSFCHSHLKAFKIKCLCKANRQSLKAGCSLYCNSDFVVLLFDYIECMYYPEEGSKSKLRKRTGVLDMNLSEMLFKHIHYCFHESVLQLRA